MISMLPGRLVTVLSIAIAIFLFLPASEVVAEESSLHTSLAFVQNADGAGTSAVSVALWDGRSKRYFANVLGTIGNTRFARVPLTPEPLQAQLVLPDLNGNGVSEIVSLEVNEAGLIDVKVKDGLTAELLAKMPFERNFQPLWIRAIPSGGIDGGFALAVLGVNAEGRYRAQVRDALTGVLISRVFFDPAYTPVAFEVVADLDSDGRPDLAVIGVDGEGRVRAQIKSLVSGNLLSMVFFDRRFAPLFAVAVDTTGDGASDAITVLGESGSGVVRAQTKEIVTGDLKGIVRFESGYEVHGLVAMPDLDGSGFPELGVLQRDVDGRVRVQVKDSVTGELVSLVPFSRLFSPRDLIVVPDINGPGTAGLAYLGEEPFGTFLIQMRNVATLQAATSIVIYAYEELVPSTVVVTPESTEMGSGESQLFSAEVFDQFGDLMPDYPVTWTTTDACVASVDPDGLVTAWGGGSATIRVSAGAVLGSAEVTLPSGQPGSPGSVNGTWRVCRASTGELLYTVNIQHVEGEVAVAGSLAYPSGTTVFISGNYLNEVLGFSWAMTVQGGDRTFSVVGGEAINHDFFEARFNDRFCLCTYDVELRKIGGT